MVMTQAKIGAEAAAKRESGRAERQSSSNNMSYSSSLEQLQLLWSGMRTAGG